MATIYESAEGHFSLTRQQGFPLQLSSSVDVAFMPNQIGSMADESSHNHCNAVPKKIANDVDANEDIKR